MQISGRSTDEIYFFPSFLIYLLNGRLSVPLPRALSHEVHVLVRSFHWHIKTLGIV
jgi:hypothetical protein